MSLKNARKTIDNLPIFTIYREPANACLPEDFPADFPLGVLKLPRATIQIIKFRGLSTIGDLVLTPPEHPVFIGELEKSIGKIKTEISSFLKTSYVPANDVISTVVAGPANKELLSPLPLYSSRRLKMNVDKIHQSFLPGIKVSKLGFSAKTRYTFMRLKVKTVGDLLLTPSDILLDKKRFGPITLKETKKKIESLMGLV